MLGNEIRASSVNISCEPHHHILLPRLWSWCNPLPQREKRSGRCQTSCPATCTCPFWSVCSDFNRADVFCLSTKMKVISSFSSWTPHAPASLRDSLSISFMYSFIHVPTQQRPMTINYVPATLLGASQGHRNEHNKSVSFAKNLPSNGRR